MSDGEETPYRVLIAGHRVQRELDSLPERDYERIISQLRNLAADASPHGSVRIRGEIYRLRVGPFRMIYQVNRVEREIIIGAVRRRSEATYRGIQRLF